MNRKTSLLTVFLCIISLTGFAMMKTLLFPDLVKQADFILIVKVTAKSQSLGGDKIPLMKTQFSVERNLKGVWPEKEPLAISSRDTQGKAIEDAMSFPAEGSRLVLFLQKTQDNSLVPLNRNQGVWPLQEGSNKTLGMGFRYSIEQIEKEVAFPQRK